MRLCAECGIYLFTFLCSVLHAFMENDIVLSLIHLKIVKCPPSLLLGSPNLASLWSQIQAAAEGRVC